MQQRLTKRTVDAVLPAANRVYVWDTDVTGFGLKVTPNGRKIYVFQYRLPGAGRKATPRRMTLGRQGGSPPNRRGRSLRSSSWR